ncbi:MAG TPA: hypothetical protein VIF11_22695 [Methylomirabilota bacterium]|jgi:hypothetical protein
MTHARLGSTWRRLFAEPAASPAIDRFLGLLTRTPYRWGQEPDGRIRADLEGTQICVITGAVRHWTGISFSIGDWVRAADVLGLTYKEAGFIVEAADEVRPGAPVTVLLRQRLLDATRIRIGAAKSIVREPLGRAGGLLHEPDTDRGALVLQ